jgi:hypothetical protein
MSTSVEWPQSGHGAHHWCHVWRHNLSQRCQSIMAPFTDMFRHVTTVNVLHNTDRYFQQFPVAKLKTYIRVGVHILVLWLKMHEDEYPYNYWLKEVMPHLLNRDMTRSKRRCTDMTFCNHACFTLNDTYRFKLSTTSLSCLQVEMKLLHCLDYDLQDAPIVALMARRNPMLMKNRDEAWLIQEKWNWLLSLVFLRFDIMQVPLAHLRIILEEWWNVHQHIDQRDWHDSLDSLSEYLYQHGGASINSSDLLQTLLDTSPSPMHTTLSSSYDDNMECDEEFNDTWVNDSRQDSDKSTTM